MIKKRTAKVIILTLVILITAISYFVSDKKLSYYGKSDFAPHNLLPYGVKPEYWGYDRGMLWFALLDEGEMTLIAKGNKYFTSDITVDSVLSYGFNDSVLVGLVLGKDSNKYYVVFKGDADIRVIDYKEGIGSIATKLKWIDNVNNPPLNLIQIHRYSRLLLTLSSLFLIILLFIIAK